MNVLSLFDGISCGQVALQRVGKRVEKYYASEIDKNAIAITMRHWPNTIQLGNVESIVTPPPGIDLLIGGSPCQGISKALTQGKLGLKDPRSKLFFEYIRILRLLPPNTKFLFENVEMTPDDEAVITGIFGMQPYRINSALVSAQNRPRLYWTNIPVTAPPADKRIFLKDIIESGYTNRAKSYCIDANYGKGGSMNMYTQCSKRQRVFITKQTTKHGIGYFLGEDVLEDEFVFTKENSRMFTITEGCRLQTLPDDYCNGISKTAAWHCLGNGWTVDIIAHFFKYL